MNETRPDVFDSLQAKRIRVYSEFFTSFGKAIVSKKLDVSGLSQFYMEIGLIGSDAVVKALARFQKVSQESLTTKDFFPVMAHLAHLVLQMRRDLIPISELTSRDILATFVRDIDRHERLLKELAKVEARKLG